MTENRPTILAVDAMGGDHAPDCVIGGIQIALKRIKDVKFLIFGDEAVVRPYLDKYRISSEMYEFVHTEDFVPPDEKPGIAVRTRRKSSMWLAIDSVKKGRADAVVSSGNTGALMAFSKVILGTLPAIHRPALLALLPTRKGKCVGLDLGANAVCDARNLVEFAVMGEVYCRIVMKKTAPVVGFLNIGSEKTKGRDEIRQAAQILENSPSESRRFYGYIEADDVGNDHVDVIVADGFSGNVLIKAIEGTAKLIVRLFKDCRDSGVFGFFSFLFAVPMLLRLKKKMDPRLYNGAMLIGLKGISIKSHGGTDAVGYANAIGVAVETVRHDLLGQISENLKNVNFPTEETSAEKDSVNA